MKTIKLHGILAKKFGKFFRLDVQTAREATHAIACQNKEFKRFMLESDNIILHHPYGRLSVREVWGEMWAKRAVVYLRHKSLI